MYALPRVHSWPTLAEKNEMQIKTIQLPKTQRFPCSKRDVKRSLAGLDLLTVEFRHTLMRTPRYARLSFDGHVLATAGVARRRDLAWLYVFPIPVDQYSDAAATEFEESLLPRLHTWFGSQLATCETGILGTEETFVVWGNETHHLEHVTFND